MLRRRHICMAAALQFLRRLIIVWELRVVDSATVICYGVVRVKRIRESLVFELAMTQSQSIGLTIDMRLTSSLFIYTRT